MSLPGSKPLSFQTKPGSNEKKENQNRRLYLWLFLLAIVFDFSSIFAFYQIKSEYTSTLGAAGDSWYIDKFYDVESNATGAYRWSKDGATVTLPPVGSPFEVQLEAQLSAHLGQGLDTLDKDPYQAYIVRDGQPQTDPVSYNLPQGYIRATIPAGNYSLNLRFENDVPRTVGDASTYLALALLVFLAWKAGFLRFKFLRLRHARNS